MPIYHEKISLFNPPRNLGIRNPIAMPIIWVEPDSDDLKPFSRIASDPRPFIPEPLRKETSLAYENAITHGPVTIISSPGLYVPMPDWLNKRIWQFDPFPAFSNHVLSLQAYNVEGSIFSPNRGKLLKYLEKTAASLTEKTGINLDLENLTPHQAVDIVFSLLKFRMNYEYLIADPSQEDIEGLRNGKIKTSSPGLIPLFEKNSKVFNKRITALEVKIDRMTTDQRLELGFGVCRHFAVDASVLYECLKQIQKGLLLNGTYLLCHSDRLSQYRSVNNHAYNIFLATRPEENDNHHYFLTVLDPTRLFFDIDYDVTWIRLAQVLGFLIKNGEKINIDNPESLATILADHAVDRVSRYFESVRKPTGFESEIWNIICDYAALLAQSSFRSENKVLSRIQQIIMMFGYSSTKALVAALGTPLFFKKTGSGDLFFENKWSEELVQKISGVDFSKTEDEDAKALIRQVIAAIKSIIRYDKKPSPASLELCYFFVKYCIQNYVSIKAKLRKDVVGFLVKHNDGKNIDNTKLVAEFSSLPDFD